MGRRMARNIYIYIYICGRVFDDAGRETRPLRRDDVKGTGCGLRKGAAAS